MLSIYYKIALGMLVPFEVLYGHKGVGKRVSNKDSGSKRKARKERMAEVNRGQEGGGDRMSEGHM